MANLRTNNLCGEGGRNAYNGSVFFNGEEDTYLSLASGALISGTGFGTNDFTVEFWINQGVNASNYTNIISLNASTTTDRFQIVFHSSTIQVYTNTGSWADTGYAPVSGVYEHIAFVRNYSGNTLKMYANGEEKWSVSNNRDYDEVFETYIGDGPSATYSALQGYLSNVRILNGTALYTTNYFTPPTSELTAIPNTVLLCCQDSDDPTQEETGKTITANGNLATAGYLETQPKVIPPVGRDAGNAFGGPIQQSTQGYMYFPTGRTEERARGRAIFAGGARSPYLDIQVVDISSGGIAQDFGDLSRIFDSTGSASSTTRMLITGSSNAGSPAPTNIIEFITIANIASSTDYGDLTVARRRTQSLSNSTRAVHVGGSGISPTPYFNTMDFNTIASLGNAADFGDALVATVTHGGSVASSTRGVYSAALVSSSYVNTIEFITIATTGNGQNFGDLSAAKGYHFRGSICDTTRGLFAGGYNPVQDTIDFVTMATTGNSTDFGNLSVARRSGGGTSNSIHSIFAGGYLPGVSNTIDRVTIQSTGNAVDFGDFFFKTHENSGSSDCHGGLS